jgi:hypothetical protein
VASSPSACASGSITLQKLQELGDDAAVLVQVTEVRSRGAHLRNLAGNAGKWLHRVKRQLPVAISPESGASSGQTRRKRRIQLAVVFELLEAGEELGHEATLIAEVGKALTDIQGRVESAKAWFASFEELRVSLKEAGHVAWLGAEGAVPEWPEAKAAEEGSEGVGEEDEEEEGGGEGGADALASPSMKRADPAERRARASAQSRFSAGGEAPTVVAVCVALSSAVEEEEDCQMVEAVAELLPAEGESEGESEAAVVCAASSELTLEGSTDLATVAVSAETMEMPVEAIAVCVEVEEAGAVDVSGEAVAVEPVHQPEQQPPIMAAVCVETSAIVVAAPAPAPAPAPATTTWPAAPWLASSAVAVVDHQPADAGAIMSDALLATLRRLITEVDCLGVALGPCESRAHVLLLELEALCLLQQPELDAAEGAAEGRGGGAVGFVAWLSELSFVHSNASSSNQAEGGALRVQESTVARVEERAKGERKREEAVALAALRERAAEWSAGVVKALADLAAPAAVASLIHDLSDDGLAGVADESAVAALRQRQSEQQQWTDQCAATLAGEESVTLQTLADLAECGDALGCAASDRDPLRRCTAVAVAWLADQEKLQRVEGGAKLDAMASLVRRAGKMEASVEEVAEQVGGLEEAMDTAEVWLERAHDAVSSRRKHVAHWEKSRSTVPEIEQILADAPGLGLESTQAAGGAGAAAASASAEAATAEWTTSEVTLFATELRTLIERCAGVQHRAAELLAQRTNGVGCSGRVSAAGVEATLAKEKKHQEKAMGIAEGTWKLNFRKSHRKNKQQSEPGEEEQGQDGGEKQKEQDEDVEGENEDENQNENEDENEDECDQEDPEPEPNQAAAQKMGQTAEQAAAQAEKDAKMDAEAVALLQEHRVALLGTLASAVALKVQVPGLENSLRARVWSLQADEVLRTAPAADAGSESEPSVARNWAVGEGWAALHKLLMQIVVVPSEDLGVVAMSRRAALKAAALKASEQSSSRQSSRKRRARDLDGEDCGDDVDVDKDGADKDGDKDHDKDSDGDDGPDDDRGNDGDGNGGSIDDVKAAPAAESGESPAKKSRRQAVASEKTEQRQSFVVGARVQARWQRKRAFYPGTIIAVNDNGTFNLDYDDDTTERNVSHKFIRLDPNAGLEPVGGDVLAEAEPEKEQQEQKEQKDQKPSRKRGSEREVERSGAAKKGAGEELDLQAARLEASTYVGCCVTKTFLDVDFAGKVIAVRAFKGKTGKERERQVFVVSYCDGDQEDLELPDLLAIVDPLPPDVERHHSSEVLGWEASGRAALKLRDDVKKALAGDRHADGGVGLFARPASSTSILGKATSASPTRVSRGARTNARGHSKAAAIQLQPSGAFAEALRVAEKRLQQPPRPFALPIDFFDAINSAPEEAADVDVAIGDATPAQDADGETGKGGVDSEAGEGDEGGEGEGGEGGGSDAGGGGCSSDASGTGGAGGADAGGAGGAGGRRGRGRKRRSDFDAPIPRTAGEKKEHAVVAKASRKKLAEWGWSQGRFAAASGMTHLEMQRVLNTHCAPSVELVAQARAALSRGPDQDIEMVSDNWSAAAAAVAGDGGTAASEDSGRAAVDKRSAALRAIAAAPPLARELLDPALVAAVQARAAAVVTWEREALFALRACCFMQPPRDISRKGRPGTKTAMMSRAPVKWIGTQVQKEFPGYGMFEGVVSGYNADHALWAVEYADGDVEQMDSQGMLAATNLHRANAQDGWAARHGMRRWLWLAAQEQSDTLDGSGRQAGNFTGGATCPRLSVPSLQSLVLRGQELMVPVRGLPDLRSRVGEILLWRESVEACLEWGAVETAAMRLEHNVEVASEEPEEEEEAAATEEGADIGLDLGLGGDSGPAKHKSMSEGAIRLRKKKELARLKKEMVAQMRKVDGEWATGAASTQEQDSVTPEYERLLQAGCGLGLVMEEDEKRIWGAMWNVRAVQQQPPASDGKHATALLAELSNKELAGAIDPGVLAALRQRRDDQKEWKEQCDATVHGKHEISLQDLADLVKEGDLLGCGAGDRMMLRQCAGAARAWLTRAEALQGENAALAVMSNLARATTKIHASVVEVNEKVTAIESAADSMQQWLDSARDAVAAHTTRKKGSSKKAAAPEEAEGGARVSVDAIKLLLDQVHSTAPSFQQSFCGMSAAASKHLPERATRARACSLSDLRYAPCACRFLSLLVCSAMRARPQVPPPFGNNTMRPAEISVCVEDIKQRLQQVRVSASPSCTCDPVALLTPRTPHILAPSYLRPLSPSFH